MACRPRYSRSRASLVWGLAAFAALQLGLALIVHFWRPELHDPEYGDLVTRLQRRLDAEPVRPYTVLMLGSSRTYNGLKASLLEERLERQQGGSVVVFNFGMPGAGPIVQVMTLQRLLAAGIRPDLLLVEVAPFLMNGRGTHTAEHIPYDRLYASDLAVLEEYGLPVADQRQDYWQCWLTPWYRYRVNVLNHAAPRWLPQKKRWDWMLRPDETGWRANNVATPTPERRQWLLDHAREEWEGSLQDFCFRESECRALEDLLNLCRREGISAKLVLMPEVSEFRDWYSPAALDVIADYLGKIQREYQVPLVDARDWVADEDFADSHHVRVTGAVAFTNRLGRDAFALPHADDQPTPSTGVIRPVSRQPSALSHVD